MATREELKAALGIWVYGSGLLYTDERSLPFRPQSGVQVGFLALDTLKLNLCAVGFSRILVPLVEEHAEGVRKRRGQVCVLTDHMSVILGSETWLMTSAETVYKPQK